MTNEDIELNIKVAEALGWEQCLNLHGQRYLVFGLATTKGAKARGDEPLADGALYYTPNYGTDKNAMHEAKKMLNDEQRGSYADHLCEIVKAADDGPGTAVSKAFFAEACQEREAFLKALGLW